MGVVQFRTTDEEEEIIAARIAAHGDKSRSDHFRRVYFQGTGTADQALGEVRAELLDLSQQLSDVRVLVHRMAEQKSSDLELRLLAGLLTLIYPSVDVMLQKKIDKYLDMGTIEKFLSGNAGGKR